MKYTSSLLAGFALLLLSAPVHAEEWDAGYSHNFFLKKRLTEKIAFESRSLFTARNEMRDINFAVADAGLSYQWNRVLKTGLAYRGAWSRGRTSWSYEHRPLINVRLASTIRDFMVSNRSRFEFRYFEGERNRDVRYRNETRIITPFELSPFKLKPYFEEEFFYSFDSSEMQMNWLSAGLIYTIDKHTRVKAGYRWKTVKVSEEWIDSHVLVTGFSFIY